MSTLLFIIGLVIGSFLNVVATRYPSLSYGGRSRCDHCRKPLKWYDLIPLVSYIITFGKCRYCGKRISIQYPIVELIAGFIFAAQPPFLLMFAGFTVLLIGVIDARLGIIPDGLNLFIVILGIAFLVLNPEFWLVHLISATAAFSFLGAIYLFSKGRAMGFGDVKMAGALGLLLGWPSILFVLASAFIFGGAWAAILLAARTKSLKDTVAFGPFIALGTILVIFLGNGMPSYITALF